MKKQKICIIGGSLTGLVTAVSLSKLNWLFWKNFWSFFTGIEILFHVPSGVIILFLFVMPNSNCVLSKIIKTSERKILLKKPGYGKISGWWIETFII